VACCRCCCGGVDCEEGQEGKCCCGGASGTCCQPGEYCCSGVCEPEPCSGCCCINGVPDPGQASQEDCELAGGIWLTAPCDPDPCTSLYGCLEPTEWRIVDGESTVYAQGPIVNLVLEDLPNPWTPEFYYATSLSLSLQVNDCGEDWQEIEQWSATVTLCGELADRYPEQPLTGPWPPPPACDCARYNSDNSVIDPCIPCPELTAGSGTGQAFRDPQPGVAVTFTGLVDGEWSNLANWEDADGETPAGSLPTGNVIIEGSVTSTAVSIEVGDLTIQAGAGFHVAASVENLYCEGLVGQDGECDGVIGSVTVTGICKFTGSGILSGEVIATLAEFEDSSSVQSGTVFDNAKFSGTSVNAGTVTGDAEFYDNSHNETTVTGVATFYDTAHNGSGPAGEVGSGSVFNGSSYNGGQVNGDAEFNNEASNAAGGVVAGNAEFNDLAANVADGTVGGNGQFFDTSSNAGAVSQDALFGGNAVMTGGTVGGNATFSGTTQMQGGDVTGTATFTDDACWVAGTAGTFVPNPPPSC
jgi:hypothetical protein